MKPISSNQIQEQINKLGFPEETVKTYKNDFDALKDLNLLDLYNPITCSMQFLNNQQATQIIDFELLFKDA